MEINQTAKIYAQSLFELNLDKNFVKSELKNVLETFTDELYDFFSNPTIDENVKFETLNDIFQNKVSEEILTFLKLLAEKGRILELSQIYESYIERLNNSENILDVEVVSAIDLDDDLKQRISSKLSEKLHKTIEPKWIVSEDIIAGLVIKIGDDIIDTSLKNKLDNLSKFIK